MCEFCTKHGEGKKWYLQMRNYAVELLHERRSARQVQCVGSETRLEWTNRFWQGFIMPAMSTVTSGTEAVAFASQSSPSSGAAILPPNNSLEPTRPAPGFVPARRWMWRENGSGAWWTLR